jgi:hypothetical protein
VYLKIPDNDFNRFKSVCLDSDFVLGQFRAPTVECCEFNEVENYPLIYSGSNMMLFGNGVINSEYYAMLKDEFGGDVNNDLWYIGKGILEHGFEWLSDVEGVFAFVIVKMSGNNVEKVLFARNTYPLYFNEKSYSSVKISDDMKLLDNGIVYDWFNDEIVCEFECKESPYLL